jgi:Ran GTPase-activating protein (RanGAP) involved in mRNA processing and transport
LRFPPCQLVITAKTATVAVKTSKVDDIIHAMRQKMYGDAFPALDPAYWKLEVVPPERYVGYLLFSFCQQLLLNTKTSFLSVASRRLKKLVRLNSKATAYYFAVLIIHFRSDRPCGNFKNAYLAVCAALGIPARPEFIYDIEHAFEVNNIKTFSLTEFDNPSPSDSRALLGALRYNSYFTGLKLKGARLEKDDLATISAVLSSNKKIEELNMSNIVGKPEAIQEVCKELSHNKDCAVRILNLSNTQIGDNGMTLLSGWIGSLNHGFTSINLSNCGIRGKGMQSFSQALKKNVHMASTLTVLNLTANKLEADGSNAFAAFLAQPNTLERVVLKDTAANLDIILGALNRGSCRDIRELDISHNKMPSKTSSTQLATFIRSASQLSKLNVAGTSLPADSLKEMIMAIYGNFYLKNVELGLAQNNLGLVGAKAIMALAAEMNNVDKLDLSDNDFDDEAVLVLAEGLCHSSALRVLNISRNLAGKSSRGQRRDAIEALTNLLASDCPIDTLIFQGNRTSALASDILNFIDAIGTDSKLLSLDLSGHGIGNKGALALSKALQTNRTLTSLNIDENGITLPGFLAIRSGM